MQVSWKHIHAVPHVQSSTSRLLVCRPKSLTGYERVSAASERSLFNIMEQSQYERPGPARPDPARPGLKRFSEAHISATAGPIDLRSSLLGSPILSTP